MSETMAVLALAIVGVLTMSAIGIYTIHLMIKLVNKDK